LRPPRYRDGDTLKTFDFVVANPPFSDKRWSTGLDPLNDALERFKPFGVPPDKQGDYAYLLHIVRSLKSTGKGACILPHGVLFRGNAEAEIRRKLVQKGYIKGIIGLPANLFYGTGIPACIIVLDKEDAHTRKSIFIVDASGGCMKDGPKNRLRSMDIHKIVDVFTRQLELPGYSRRVPIEALEGNDFNLNIPRYIDRQQTEDIQDIDAHLRGGIPVADVDALEAYWEVCPQLRQTLFKDNRPGYVDLTVPKASIQQSIYAHPEFVAFKEQLGGLFEAWQEAASETLAGLTVGFTPRTLIVALGERLLAHYEGKPLIDKYDVYQHLMDYWAETMQDDCYLIAADGWKAETARVLVKNKAGKEVDRGWVCDLVPKPLMVAHYYASEQAALNTLQSDLEGAGAKLSELEEAHSGDDGFFAELEKVNKANVAARAKELKGDRSAKEELKVLKAYLELTKRQTVLKKAIKEADARLDQQVYERYPTLSVSEIKTLVVEDKWMASLRAAIRGETDRISQALTRRVKELAERYELALPAHLAKIAELEQRVNGHLERMGFVS